MKFYGVTIQMKPLRQSYCVVQCFLYIFFNILEKKKFVIFPAFGFWTVLGVKGLRHI